MTEPWPTGPVPNPMAPPETRTAWPQRGQPAQWAAPTPWQPPAPRAPRAGDAGRVVAIDLARFLAIVGMMAAHIVMPASSAWQGMPSSSFDAAVADAITPLVNGNASTLFAVIGGMSLVLSTRTQLAAGHRGAALASTATRALLVMVLGFVLSGLGAPVYVVLHYFGWSMLLAMPLLLAPLWVTGVVAALLVIGGPWLLVAVRAARWGVEGTPLVAHAVDRLDGNPVAAIVDLTFTGEYPAITWVAYMAIGMLLARLLLRLRRQGVGRVVGGGMLALGAALVAAAVLTSTATLDAMAPTWASEHGMVAEVDMLLLVGDGGPPGAEWWWQLTAIAHTGTAGDLVRGLGASLVVLGALVLALPPGSRTPFVLRPLRAVGAAPLTLYTAHVLALAVSYALWFGLSMVTGGGEWLVIGTGAWIVHVLAAVALGVLLAAVGTRGPLEAATSGAARAVGAWLTPQPARQAPPAPWPPSR